MSMTIKEVADKVRDHLLTQMEKSAIADQTCKNGIRCLYRGPDGLKCAVGALIKDEFYHPDLENLLCSDMKVFNALESSGVYGGDEDVHIEEMLTDFQSIHDNYTPKNWKDLISDLYIKYGIES